MVEKNEKLSGKIDVELGVLKTSSFSESYPVLNKYMLDNLSVQSSRNGNTKELLDFKTQLINPYNRCVGGFGRDINIFFLLAEAVWIFAGKKDVNFLSLFNKKMSDFSDDGKVFHAPYGFRLRHWGVRSEDIYVEENMHASQGRDQVSDAIRLLSDNPDNRQVVLQIWNPDFDLGVKTKDIPCNDTLMLKVRDGKLITTIQNRSNDLHWGLPTNIFQFSFLTELISNCLGVTLGTQTHNSQSLHIYEWNDTADEMKYNFEERILQEESTGGIISNLELYEVSESQKIDMSFEHEVPANRLREIDFCLNLIIDNLTRVSNGDQESIEELKHINNFSSYLFLVYRLCKLYLQYKKSLSFCATEEGKNTLRLQMMVSIDLLAKGFAEELDIVVLAKNFFASRITNFEHKFLGTL